MGLLSAISHLVLECTNRATKDGFHSAVIGNFGAGSYALMLGLPAKLAADCPQDDARTFRQIGVVFEARPLEVLGCVALPI